MSRCRLPHRSSNSSSCRLGLLFGCSWPVAAQFLLLPQLVSSFRSQAPTVSSCSKKNYYCTSRTASRLYAQPPQMLEVEEKFSFSDRSALEDRLRLQGFSPFQEITMVDWYFDRVDLDDRGNDESSSCQELPLVKKDHWLRYRQITSKNGVEWTKDGEWQLKRGNPGQKSSGGATVYEEIEGPEAVQIANAVVAQDQSDVQESKASSSLSSPRIFDGHSVPVLPLEGGCDLVPFARIVTQRAQWKPQQKDANNNTVSSFLHLVVDLDTTPDGFAVGEVEALVEDADQVEQARTKIREFVSRILDESRADAPPMGKLEQFLYRKQPRIYELCVESGVVPRRSIPNETATSDC